MNTIGYKLKSLRKELGLRQSDVVGDHLSRTMLSKIESNSAKPSLSTIEYLANKLGKPISYFLDEEVATYSFNRSKTEELFFEVSLHFRKEEYKAITSNKSLLLTHKMRDEDPFKGRLLYLHAHALVRLKNKNKAEPLLIEAINLLKTFNDYYYLARSHYALANILISKTKYSEALKSSLNAITLLEQSYVDDTILTINCNYNTGYIYFLMQDYSMSIEYFDKVLKYSYLTNVHSSTGHTYLTLALIYSWQDKYDLAIDIAKAGEKYFDFQNDAINLHKTHANLANYYLETKDFDQCLYYINLANEDPVLIDGAGTANFMAILLSRYYILTSDYKAFSHVFADLKLSSVSRYHTKIANELNDLITSMTDMAYIQKILDILVTKYDTLSDEVHQSSYYEVLSNLYSKTEAYEEAYIYLKKSQDPK